MYEKLPTEDTNKWFADNIKPDYMPPYKPRTRVKEIMLTRKLLLLEFTINYLVDLVCMGAG